MARVLVADDNPDSVFVMALALDDAGHEAIPVGNLEQADLAVRTLAIDCVVLDTTAADRTGSRLLELLRTGENQTWIPCVLISPARPAGGRHALPSHRQDQYLTKPFRASEIVAAVAQALMEPEPELAAPLTA